VEITEGLVEKVNWQRQEGHLYGGCRVKVRALEAVEIACERSVEICECLECRFLFVEECVKGIAR
jgi:hypothetical protein